MRKFYLSLFAVVLFLSTANLAFSQSVGNYTTARTTGITYTSISGSGSSISGTWRNALSTDDNLSAAQNIGFTFYYDGVAYTQYSISTNGYLTFNVGTSAIGSLTGAYGYQNTQFSATSGTVTTLAPFYDDQQTAGNLGTQADLDGTYKYLLTGSAPNRVATIEWINSQDFSTTSTSSFNYQVKLYEADGHIEFVYGTMTLANSSTLTTMSYSLGINAPTISASPTTSELLTQQTVNTNTFSNTASNSLGGATPANMPTTNSMISFTPQSTSPAAPTTITFSSVTQTSMTVGWTDNSTTENFFTVQRSTSVSGPWTTIGTVSSTTRAGTGTTYSSNQTSLAPGTTYYYQILSANEGTAPSSALTGNQITNAAGVKTSVAGAVNWNSAASWSPSGIPGSTDDVTIIDGSTVTIDVAASCNNLTVGQGTTGILQFEVTTARTLTVTNDVTVAANGTFRVQTSGTVQAGHILNLSGNLTNNGIIDFNNSTWQQRADIRFSGSNNSTFSGSASTANTDLGLLSVNKGSGTVTTSSPYVDITLTNGFNARNSATGPWLNTTTHTGIVKISGSFTKTNDSLFTAAGWTIASTGGLWINNSSYSCLGMSGSPTMSGLLRVSAGTFNCGAVAGNAMGAAATSTFLFDGGTLNFSGRFNNASACVFTISSGILNICTVGNASTATPSFGLTSSSAVVTMSGGTINMVQTTTGTVPQDYYVAATLTGTKGTTLNFGTSATTLNASGRGYGFRGIGYMPIVNIDNTTNAKSLFDTLISGTIYGNFTINTGCTFNVYNSSAVTSIARLFAGSTLTNNGAIVGTGSNARFDFQGSGAQSYSGTGTFGTSGVPFAGVGVGFSNTSGVTLNSPIITNRVNLFTGTVTNSNQISIGTGGSASCFIQRGGSTGNPSGTFDQAPTFNLGTGSLSYSYSTASTAVTTSFEIPSSRNVGSITLNNTNGITLAGGNLNMVLGTTPTLTMTLGNLDLGGNTLTVGASAATVGAITNTTGFVQNGTLTRWFGTSSLPTTIANSNGGHFPMGSSNNNRNLWLAFSTSTALSTGGTISVTHTSATGTTSISSYSDGGVNVDTRSNASWGVTQSGCVLTGTILARIQASGGLFAVNTLANLRMVNSTLGAFATSSNGTNTAADPQVNRTSMTLTDLVSTLYFGGNSADMGSLISWVGTTGNWSNPANWSSNPSVPSSTDNISIAPGSASVITVDGNYAVNSMTVGTNATVNLGSNTLTANGGYTQSAGIINLGTGTLDVKGNFTKSGGTFTQGTGTLSLTGTTASQTITFGGTQTLYNIVMAGGNAGGFSKIFTSAQTLTFSNNYTVQTDAKLALTSASATSHSIAGNLVYSGATGGSNLSSLTITLTGTGKTIDGSSLDNHNVTNTRQRNANIVEKVFNLQTDHSQNPNVIAAMEKVSNGSVVLDESKTSQTVLDGKTDVTKSENSKSDEVTSQEVKSDKISETEKNDITVVKQPIYNGVVTPENPKGLRFDNTYEMRKDYINDLVSKKARNERLVFILDDATVTAGGDEENTDVTTTTFEFGLTISSAGSYTLNDNIAMASGKTLTISGRLNAGSNVISGTGGIVSLSATGTLGIASSTAQVIGGTITTSGTNVYTTGGKIEFNASGDQALTMGDGSTTGFPPTVTLVTAGTGVKTLSGRLILSLTTTSTIPAITVSAGSTFADGGNEIWLLNATASSGSEIQVDVLGTYSSTGSGKIVPKGNAWGGGIRAVTGTTLGDINLKFSTSTNLYGLNSSTTSAITCRNVTFDSSAGGKLLLNASGTTTLQVSGNVSIAPTTVTNTGGGFDELASTVGSVKIAGNVTSTSTSTSQALMSRTGTSSAVEFNGSSAQTIDYSADNAIPTLTILTTVTWTINNAAGVELRGNGANNVCTFTAASTGSFIYTLGALSLQTSPATDVLAYAANSTCTFSGGTISASSWPTSNGPTNVTVTSSCTLPGDRSVSGTFTLSNGFFDCNGNTLTIGTSTSTLGTLTYTGGAIRGSLRRWFAASTVNNVIFPVDNGSGAFSQANLSFTGAPSSGGTLTCTFHNSGSGQLPESGGSGNGYYIPTDPTMGNVNLVNLAPQYWTITAADGLTGGTYSLDLTGDGIPNVSNLAYVAIIKRPDGASPWTWSTGNYSVTTGSNSNPVFHYVGGTSFSDFGIGGNIDNLLPVELASFTASINKRDVAMNWATIAEENNVGFDIERKPVEVSTWNKIGFVTGHGTSGAPHNYTYADRNVQTGKYNYRLKQIDVNGNYKYYNLTSEVEIGVPGKYDMSQNYPNPFNPTTKINYDLPFDSKVSIRIFDMTGREMAQIVNTAQTAGYYTVQFNASNLASGTYFYNIVAEGGNNNKFVTTKKMILVK